MDCRPREHGCKWTEDCIELIEVRNSDDLSYYDSNSRTYQHIDEFQGLNTHKIPDTSESPPLLSNVDEETNNLVT